MLRRVQMTGGHSIAPGGGWSSGSVVRTPSTNTSTVSTPRVSINGQHSQHHHQQQHGSGGHIANNNTAGGGPTTQGTDTGDASPTGLPLGAPHLMHRSSHAPYMPMPLPFVTLPLATHYAGIPEVFSEVSSPVRSARGLRTQIGSVPRQEGPLSPHQGGEHEEERLDGDAHPPPMLGALFTSVPLAETNGAHNPAHPDAFASVSNHASVPRSRTPSQQGDPDWVRPQPPPPQHDQMHLVRDHGRPASRTNGHSSSLLTPRTAPSDATGSNRRSVGSSSERIPSLTSQTGVEGSTTSSPSSLSGARWQRLVRSCERTARSAQELISSNRRPHHYQHHEPSLLETRATPTVRLMQTRPPLSTTTSSGSIRSAVATAHLYSPFSTVSADSSHESRLGSRNDAIRETLRAIKETMDHASAVEHHAAGSPIRQQPSPSFRRFVPTVDHGGAGSGMRPLFRPHSDLSPSSQPPTHHPYHPHGRSTHKSEPSTPSQRRQRVSEEAAPESTSSSTVDRPQVPVLVPSSSRSGKGVVLSTGDASGGRSSFLSINSRGQSYDNTSREAAEVCSPTFHSVPVLVSSDLSVLHHSSREARHSQSLESPLSAPLDGRDCMHPGPLSGAVMRLPSTEHFPPDLTVTEPSVNFPPNQGHVMRNPSPHTSAGAVHGGTGTTISGFFEPEELGGTGPAILNPTRHRPPSPSMRMSEFSQISMSVSNFAPPACPRSLKNNSGESHVSDSMSNVSTRLNGTNPLVETDDVASEPCSTSALPSPCNANMQRPTLESSALAFAARLQASALGRSVSPHNHHTAPPSQDSAPGQPVPQGGPLASTHSAPLPQTDLPQTHRTSPSSPASAASTRHAHSGPTSPLVSSQLSTSVVSGCRSVGSLEAPSIERPSQIVPITAATGLRASTSKSPRGILSNADADDDCANSLQSHELARELEDERFPFAVTRREVPSSSLVYVHEVAVPPEELLEGSRRSATRERSHKSPLDPDLTPPVPDTYNFMSPARSPSPSVAPWSRDVLLLASPTGHEIQDIVTAAQSRKQEEAEAARRELERVQALRERIALQHSPHGPAQNKSRSNSSDPVDDDEGRRMASFQRGQSMRASARAIALENDRLDKAERRLQHQLEECRGPSSSSLEGAVPLGAPLVPDHRHLFPEPLTMVRGSSIRTVESVEIDTPPAIAGSGAHLQTLRRQASYESTSSTSTTRSSSTPCDIAKDREVDHTLVFQSDDVYCYNEYGQRLGKSEWF